MTTKAEKALRGARKEAIVEKIAPAIKFDGDKIEKIEDFEALVLAGFNEKSELQLTPEMVLAVQQLENETEAALVSAVGKPGVDHLKANEEIATIRGDFIVGQTKFNYAQHRMTDRHNPAYNPEKEGSQQRIIKHGLVDVSRKPEKFKDYDDAVKDICALGADLLGS